MPGFSITGQCKTWPSLLSITVLHPSHCRSSTLEKEPSCSFPLSSGRRCSAVRQLLAAQPAWVHKHQEEWKNLYTDDRFPLSPSFPSVLFTFSEQMLLQARAWLFSYLHSPQASRALTPAGAAGLDENTIQGRISSGNGLSHRRSIQRPPSA